METKKKENDFYKNKKVIKIDDIDVNKVLVSKEEPYGTKFLRYKTFKYFIGYKDNDVTNHYAWSFHKRLAMLENLKVIQQCLLRLMISNC